MSFDEKILFEFSLEPQQDVNQNNGNREREKRAIERNVNWLAWN